MTDVGDCPSFPSLHFKRHLSIYQYTSQSTSELPGAQHGVYFDLRIKAEGTKFTLKELTVGWERRAQRLT